MRYGEGLADETPIARCRWARETADVESVGPCLDRRMRATTLDWTTLGFSPVSVGKGDRLRRGDRPSGLSYDCSIQALVADLVEHWVQLMGSQIQAVGAGGHEGKNKSQDEGQRGAQRGIASGLWTDLHRGGGGLCQL